MEILYTQSFSWARITAYKDYCRLIDKDKKRDLYSIHVPNKKYLKKQVCFFHSDFDENKVPAQDIFSLEKTPDNIQLESFRTNGKGGNHFDTKNQKQITRHFGRPFSSVYLYFYERSIIKKDHKIYIKFKKFIKYRDVNKKYFKKSISSISIIIDTHSGNFKTVTFDRNGKNSSSYIRTNNFYKLKLLINQVLNVKKYFVDKVNVNRYEKELLQIFDEKEFKKNVFKTLSIETNVQLDKLSSTEFFITFLNYFISKKEIGVPDVNYHHLLINYYPTEKYLKKNKRKLIASILDMFGFKSKQTIKLLHQYPNLNIQSFIKLCKIFGKDYNDYLANINKLVFQIDNSMISVSTDSNDPNSTTKHNVFNILSAQNEYTIEEKKFIIRILNCVDNIRSTNVLSEVFLNQLEDHINMYRRILVYNPNLKISARDFNELRDEHMEFSKLNSVIKKGWVLEYQFDKKTIDEIEKEYEVICENGDKVKLYPYLLKREEEYSEEGNFMHHCVALYADKDRSVIVSVRTEDLKNRVTVEFDIQSGRMLQARHFCNGQPPILFESVIDELKNIISRMARYGTLNWKEKKKVPLKINGIEINKTEVEEFFL